MDVKIKKFLSYYRPYRSIFFLDLFFSLLNAIITLLIPIVVMKTITCAFVSDENKKPFLMVSLGIGIISFLFVALYMCNYFTIYYGKMMGTKIECDMRNEIFAHYQKLSSDFFDKNNIGELMSNVTVDLNNISELIHRAPEEILTSGVKMIGTFIVLFYINSKLAFSVLSIIVLIFIFICYFIPKINRAVMKKHKKISDISVQLENSLSGINVVKSFTNENLEIKKFAKVNDDFVKVQSQWIKLLAKFDSGACSFIIGLIPLTTILTSFFILKKSVVLSDLIMFMMYIDIIINPIFTTIKLIDEYFQDSLAGYRRFLNVLNTIPSIINVPHPIVMNEMRGDIDFENVYFQYVKKNNFVLNNINLNINAGEYVALVGASGAGKSTLCKLLPRFYDVSQGEIKIDGVGIKNIKLEFLRKNIGFVQQDTYLFNGSIFDNIKYGKPDATYDEVVQAAKKAFAHEFIINSLNGYNTEVGSRGENLSGGQRQRIALARVFLKSPSILIFDEATSSLDTENEKYIQQSLNALRNCCTTIVIAHRLSTIKHAQRILVLERGRIVEEGVHETLLSKNGVYANLYKAL